MWSESHHLTQSFPHLRAAGASIDTYRAIVQLPRVERIGSLNVLLIPGPDPLILLASEDAAEVNWIDFSIELVLGLVGLFTGFKLGRAGYAALKPVIHNLYHSDPDFREKIQATGRDALKGDAFGTGRAVRDMWIYLWRQHRREVFPAILRAIGRALRPRYLLLLLARWLLRLISAGASMTLEIGLLVMPLSRKLRAQEGQSKISST